METKQRRAALSARLHSCREALTGTALAREFGVSRQVIVGDIAILRAAGMQILATPQGYVVPQEQARRAVQATLACRHSRAQLAQELFTIVDLGGRVLDVSVEHPVYGEMKGRLLIASRRDVERFLQNLEEEQAQPLSLLTGGVHLHTVEAPDEETLAAIKDSLIAQCILLR